MKKFNQNIHFLFLGFSIFLFQNIYGQDAGNVSGGLSVSLSGAASYSVPLAVPPGIKDVVPSLSISYSSQAANGLAGWGWNIGGLSTITRTGKTIFHNGIQGGISPTRIDGLALDGQRLLLVSGTYGSAGSVYRTENFNNLKIIAYGATSKNGVTGPDSFKIFHPNGSIATYGGSGATGVMEWAIASTVDTQQNAITYSYLGANLLRIANIQYGNQLGKTMPNNITFGYNDRNRPEVAFTEGFTLERTQLLAGIEVKGSGNTLFRSYTLTHNTTTAGYERLTSVKVTNGTGTALTPLTFTYETIQPDAKVLRNFVAPSETLDVNREDNIVLTGDFSGDGHLDLIAYNKVGIPSLSVVTDLYKGGSLGAANVYSLPRFTTLLSGTIKDQNNIIAPQQGLATVNSMADGNVIFTTYVILDEALRSQQSKTWKSQARAYQSECSSSTQSSIPRDYLSGDFNGDGLLDVLAINKEYTNQYCTPTDPDCIREIYEDGRTGGCPCDCYSIRSEGGTMSYIDISGEEETSFSPFNTSLKNTRTDTERMLSLDVNGDGKTNLVHVQDNGNLDIYGLDETKAMTLLFSQNTDYLKPNIVIVPGDFNGDGKTDIAVPEQRDNSRVWRYYISHGDRFVLTSRSGSILYEEPQNKREFHYIGQDFNGDGKTDILRHKLAAKSSDAQFGTLFEEISLSLNVGFRAGAPDFELSFEKEFDGPPGEFYTGFPLFLDITNKRNGKLEYAYLSGSSVRAYTFTNDEKLETLLQSVTNRGFTTTIAYNGLGEGFDPNDGAPYYLPAANPLPYPYQQIAVARNFKVVQWLSEKWDGNTRFKDYRYQGATTHNTGLGFMGFTFRAESEWAEASDKVWQSSRHSPEMRGAVTESWTGLSPNNQENISQSTRTTYSYDTQLAASKLFSNPVTKTVTQNLLTDITTTETVGYDTYNNPLDINVTTGTDFNERTVLTYSDAASAVDASYHIGRPLTSNNTIIRNGQTFATSETFEYENNLLKVSTKKGSGTETLTETTTYDGFGNKASSTLSDGTLTPRVQKFTYTPDGRFMQSTTDIEGRETQFTYNTVTGMLATTTDPFNRKMSYGYDAWQRLSNETDYLGISTTYGYANTQDGGLKSWVNYTQGPDTETYLNAQGWETKVRMLSLNSLWSTTTIEYNDKGQIARTSDPYYEGSGTPLWTVLSYDPFNRPISQLLPTGKVITTAYNIKQTLVDDGTRSVATTINGAGDIAEVTDPGGTITYSYHGNGELRTADYGGQRITTEIDGWGRRTRLSDPSAGTYTYAYNTYGELLESTTPKGSTIHTYDAYGKQLTAVQKGDETDMQITYAYTSKSQLG